MNKAFIDIGELGWSMYIHAHIRWLKKNADDSIAIITYPDRRCLYEGLVDIVQSVPPGFYTTFNVQAQNCLGIQKVLPDVVKAYFMPHLPDGYRIPDDFVLSCKWHYWEYDLDFTPYKYAKKLAGKPEILVFPRHRVGGWYSFRNLKESFYIELIKRLCDEYPKFNIRTIGTKMGAYNINIDKPNYINYVGKGDGLQDMIDRCQLAVATAGSQSGPVKIALLQGVPSYIIGHQRERHIGRENWMDTEAEFYQVPNKDYSRCDENKCIEAIVSFIKSKGRIKR